MYTFSDYVLPVLRLYGWNAQRKVDVSATIASLAVEGWVVFDAARTFLESFDGLIEFTPPSVLHVIDFVPLTTEERHDFYREFEIDWGKRIYPVGTYEWVHSMFIDTNGAFLVHIDNVICVYEGDLNSIFEKLFWFSAAYTIPVNIRKWE